MKIFIALLVVSVFALSAFAQAGDAMFTQTYNYSDAENGIQSASLADDFVPNFSGVFQHIVLWMTFQGTPPDDIFIEVSEDNGDIDPNTAATLISGSLVASLVDTGDLINGRSVYEVTLSFPTVTPVSAGELYWLEVGTVTGSYWVYQEPVVFGTSLWYFDAGQFHNIYDTFGYSWDTFFEIRTPVALQRSSWGSIKASF
ncbi:MAG: hypothetical protein B1H09_04340 [Gemmatimonadaceae bacterium 4484_173]|nr:MAG: hypothetical protein B1H09_04340 [Gemmatimonadaceae bacterium 4484_173]RKZ01310.1 MAG: hypothetical protein DRQ21_10930 [Candidatus Fermentibacteria bacterium]